MIFICCRSSFPSCAIRSNISVRISPTSASPRNTANTAGEVYYFDECVVKEYTGTQNVVDYVVQAVDGSTATGAAHTTVKTKLQLAWAKLFQLRAQGVTE